MPALLTKSRLNTPDTDAFEGWMVPGAPMDDAPVVVSGQARWLLREVASPSLGDFTLLVFGDDEVTLPKTPVPVVVRRVKTPGSLVIAGDIIDSEGHVSRRYDAQPGTVYLLRPDQHVAARWRAFDAAKLQAALNRALCMN